MTKRTNIFPGVLDAFLHAPLYVPYVVSPDQFNEVDNFSETLHLWCPACNRESVFQIQNDTGRMMRRAFTGTTSGLPAEPQLPPFAMIEKTFKCAANYRHSAFFAFALVNGELQKVGQYPSRSELDHQRFNKYRKISNDTYRELVRAAHLAAADVHIAAFVYLRRIFERLVSEAAATRQAADSSWNRAAWDAKRMGEKIDELALHLPEFLTKNKTKLYGILSRGIHDLSEDDCALYFPVMSAAIESILDYELERRTQAQRAAETEKALSQIKI